MVTIFLLSVASALTRLKSSNCANIVNIIFHYNLFNSAARQNIVPCSVLWLVLEWYH